ncbi:MAG: hypothetical protein VB071_12290 [Lawsonibacter sp.]|nr:hypothetical protein [Lawsonibacter sp.]
MSQGFKQFLWQLRIEPISQLMLMGYAIFLVLMVLTLDGVYLMLALFWVLLLTILGRTANNGHPAWLATVLTPNFYAVRALNGRWSIFQRRRGKGGPADRRAALKELVAEQTLLPAALKPGRYQAITHDTVLRRLKALPNVSEVVVTPAYRAALKATWGKGLRGSRRFASRKRKQFYLVRFQVIPIT